MQKTYFSKEDYLSSKEGNLIVMMNLFEVSISTEWLELIIQLCSKKKSTSINFKYSLESANSLCYDRD